MKKKTAFLILIYILGNSIICLGQGEHNNLYKSYKDYLSKIDADIKDHFFFGAKVDDKNIVCFTFDDGPLRNTEKIIRVLKDRNCPATFFVLVKNISQSNYHLYKDPLFEVGIHGYSHDDYSKYSEEELNIEINKCIRKFKKFNLPLLYFRPPYGIISRDLKNTLKKNQLKGILWNFDSQDWSGLTDESLINNVTNNLCSGSVVLFHDTINTDYLIKIIDNIRNMGYKIVPLKEIIDYGSSQK